MGSALKSDQSTITVALIDDNRMVREGLAALLSRLPDLDVVMSSATPDTEALEKAAPRVVLLDLGLDNGDSLAAAERVRDELPDAKVIVMDLMPVHEEIVEYVNVGVVGFIMKDATLEELAGTIRSVAAGVSVLPPQMAGSLFSQIAREAVAGSGPASMDAVRMTPRERQVVDLIAEGLSNKDIAKRLHIATHTVKSHVRNIMEKLTLHSRLQIAAYAYGQKRA